MSGDAIFMMTIDAKTKKPKPLMVIVATTDQVLAAGDPSTMSAQMADSLMETFKSLPSNEKPKAIQDMIDGMRSGSRGYAHEIEVVPYVGANKDRADDLLKRFMSRRVDALLRKS